MDKKEYLKAIKLLQNFREKAKDLKPGQPDRKGYTNYLLDFILGNCFFELKKYNEAKFYYLSSVKKKPNFSIGWLNLAQCYYELKDYINAAKSFVMTYKFSSKKDPQYLYYAGVCFLSANMPKKALHTLRQLFKLNIKQKLEWKEAIAHAYIACNMLKDALPYIVFLSENEAGKKKKQWQQIRLHIYLSLNMEKKALEYLKALIHDDPFEPKWWKGLAHLYLKEHKYKNALVALIIKGFLSPLTKQEKDIAAQLSMVIGIPKEALKFYMDIAAKGIDKKLAYYISQCYVRLHRLKEALRFVDNGLKIDPDDKRLLFLKGDLLYQLGRYKESAIVFEKAARKNIYPAKSWLMAGYAFWNAKELKKAYFAFKKASKYPSNRSYLSKILKVFKQKTKE